MKKHILIVDDEAPIRELLDQYLTGKGYRVTAVENASEAQRVAVSDTPALLISDLQLEDSDGLDMIDSLKSALPPTTPIILLTGVLFDPQVVRETLSKKITSYFQKTTPLIRILEEVRRLIGE
jgi:DNA-binding NtrC family response regulator